MLQLDRRMHLTQAIRCEPLPLTRLQLQETYVVINLPVHIRIISKMRHHPHHRVGIHFNPENEATSEPRRDQPPMSTSLHTGEYLDCGVRCELRLHQLTTHFGQLGSLSPRV
jgi:hypothetical protein